MLLKCVIRIKGQLEILIMNINKRKMQYNALLIIAKKTKLYVNISDISAILGIRYLVVKNEIICSEKFPKPIIDGDLPLSRKWLLYDVLLWELNRK